LLTFAPGAPGQELPSTTALDRAAVVDELEHDAAHARELYSRIAADEKAPEPVRRHAWLRLGRLAMRSGGDAKAALEKAAAGDDAVALAAKDLLKEPAQDPERLAALRERAAALVAKIDEKKPTPSLINDTLWFGE